MLIRVPLSWLRAYVDVTISVDDLAHRLHMSGTEVKGIERQKWDKIWVGRVAELSKASQRRQAAASRPSTTARADGRSS